MPASNGKRLVLGFILLVSLVNVVRALQQPDTLRFFGIALIVAATVAAVGSLAALLLAAVRRLSSN